MQNNTMRRGWHGEIFGLVFCMILWAGVSAAQASPTARGAVTQDVVSQQAVIAAPKAEYCLGAIAGYSEWLERVDAMRLGGAQSGFYGNPLREIGRIENGRYVVLRHVTDGQSATDLASLMAVQPVAWRLRLDQANATRFRALGDELRAEVEHCIREIVVVR
ncbi:hypothetical protein ERN12_08510 [Rhodobacteraceae bacterium]|nr:hypothetical protein ERN12_08510 [Paracoccaceae bacterium]